MISLPERTAIMRRLPVCLMLAAFALAVGGTSSFAQNPSLYACSYPKLGIPTCTRLIEGGTLQGAALAKIYWQRAYQFQDLGELGRAIADYSEAIRHNPDDTMALINRAHLLQKKGDYGAAIDDWRRIGALDKGKSWLLGRAGVYVAMGVYDRAIEDYSQALEDFPFEARWHRAYAYHRVGAHQRALDEMNVVLSEHFDSAPLLHAVRSVIFSGLGARDLAAADLREARTAEAERRREWPRSITDPTTQEWLDRAEQQLGESLQNSSKPGSHSSKMEKLLPSVEGSKSCYSRIYDPEHLRANPRQTVSALALQLSYRKHPASERGSQAPAGHYFKLVAKLRTSGKVLTADGECTVRNDQIWCGAECDGGGIYLDMSGDISTLMMKIDDRLRMSKRCEQRSAPELTPATRGERFKLHKADRSTCDVPR
jgi:tetratricopeptide (TPR) repeat protein